jgi:hypothetical protein
LEIHFSNGSLEIYRKDLEGFETAAIGSLDLTGSSPAKIRQLRRRGGRIMVGGGLGLYLSILSPVRPSPLARPGPGPRQARP